MRHDRTRTPELRLVVVPGGLVALGPLTTALYLPALPGVVDDLATSPTAIQLTLTGTLLGVVLGQLLVGPLSDAVGRRLPLLTGATVHVLASVGCAVAPTVTVLVAARVLQGIGAAAGAVLALAIIRDLFTGRRAAALLSRLLLILGAATVLAPPAGAGLLAWTQWRGVFAALAGIGILMTALAAWGLADTLPPQRRRPLALRGMLRTYGALLRDPAFVGMIGVVGLTMAALYAYLAAAPFVFAARFGLDPQQVGLLLGTGSVVFVGATQLNPLLLNRHEAQHILIAAALAGGAAGAALCVTAAMATGGFLAVVLPLFVVLFALGLMLPNAPVLALTDHGDTAGTAAALVGAAQFGTAALAAPLVGVLGNDTRALATVVTAALILASTTLALIIQGQRRARRRVDHGAPADAIPSQGR